MKRLCTTTGCPEDAEFLDEFGNELCESCVQKDIDDNNNLTMEDFETLENN